MADVRRFAASKGIMLAYREREREIYIYIPEDPTYLEMEGSGCRPWVLRPDPGSGIMMVSGVDDVTNRALQKIQ